MAVPNCTGAMELCTMPPRLLSCWQRHRGLILQALLLSAIWLLLSGKLEPIYLLWGAISVALVLWLSSRIKHFQYVTACMFTWPVIFNISSIFSIQVSQAEINFRINSIPSAPPSNKSPETSDPGSVVVLASVGWNFRGSWSFRGSWNFLGSGGLSGCHWTPR